MRTLMLPSALPGSWGPLHWPESTGPTCDSPKACFLSQAQSRRHTEADSVSRATFISGRGTLWVAGCGKQTWLLGSSRWTLLDKGPAPQSQGLPVSPDSPSIGAPVGMHCVAVVGVGPMATCGSCFLSTSLQLQTVYSELDQVNLELRSAQKDLQAADKEIVVRAHLARQGQGVAVCLPAAGPGPLCLAAGVGVLGCRVLPSQGGSQDVHLGPGLGPGPPQQRG